LNGAFRLSDDIPLTEFRKLTRRLMLTISRDRRFARTYYNAVFGLGLHGAGTQESDDATNVLSFADAELIHLTSLPYRSPETLFRYAHCVARFWDEPDHGWTAGVEAPALIVTAGCDQIAHQAESEEIHRKLTDSELVLLPQGDHFSVYRDGALVDRVFEFIAGSRDGRPQPAVTGPGRNTSGS
jgi:pimeloyl-ACP methyl ester carboxylesterase